MKTVLVYGDSNVYGESAFDKFRIAHDKRWVNILSLKLGTEWTVIPEGLSGRLAGNLKTTANKKYMNGKSYFKSTYLSHTPVGLLIIALGTNDLQYEYEQTAADILESLRFYTDLPTNDNGDTKHILLIQPSSFVSKKDYYFASKDLHQELTNLLQDSDLDLIKAENISLTEDGVHFSEEGHQQMAEIVHGKIKELNV